MSTTTSVKPVLLVAGRFDYAVVAPDIAEKLQLQAVRIRERIVKTTESIIETGCDLLAAQQAIEYGLFINWGRNEIGIEPRTAQNCMKAAKLAEKHGSETVSHLPPAALYKLASKSTPPEVVITVLARVEAGETMPAKLVADILVEARHQQRRLKKDQRQRERRSKKFHNRRAQEQLDAERRRVADETIVSEIAEKIVAKLGPEHAIFVREKLEQCGRPRSRGHRSQGAPSRTAGGAPPPGRRIAVLPAGPTGCGQKGDLRLHPTSSPLAIPRALAITRDFSFTVHP
jgi:hypothetical protein